MKHKLPPLSRLFALSVVALAAGNASALTVALTSDSNPPVPGELRHAIANTAPGGTVDFAPGLAGSIITLTPANGSFTVNQNLTIDGTNAPGLVIDGVASASVFTVNNPATSVAFRRLTIRNGSGTNGGGIYIGTACTVTVSESTIESNQATGQGGGIYAWMGGRLDVKGCLIANNTSGSQGGGIYAGGAATLTNTTVAGNGNTVTPIGGGGGLYAAGSLTVTHCTFSNNAAGPAGNGTYIDGIFASIPSHLVNTIISSGRGNKDCYSLGIPAFLTNINNLIADGAYSPLLSGSPLLAPLANNGGPTQTQALLLGSPCRNAAAGASSNDPGLNGIPGGGDDVALLSDQRGTGFARSAGGTPDIGAFELRIQPDNRVGKTANPSTGLGNNRYNTTGAGQTLNQVSKQASLVRATLTIENDGDHPDILKLRGSRGNALFHVTYSDGGRNITAAVTTGAHATPTLSPNQHSAVSILVRPDRKKLQTGTRVACRVNVTWLKRRLSLVLTSTSQNDANGKDVAKVDVRHL
jgi:predicted outer membrane repeat protein